MDRALEILKNHNSFTTERERQQRDILIAAIDNLVDFAAAEEYAMLGELPETADEQDMEAHEKICRRYNLVHAEEENNQVFFAASMAWLMTSFSHIEPSRHAKLMRESSWCTTRPAPMFRCPTSELPICPAGKPTASPEAASFVHEHVSNKWSSVGVFASDTALPGPGSARPKPSMMTRHAGSVNALRTVSFAAITGTLSQAG